MNEPQFSVPVNKTVWNGTGASETYETGQSKGIPKSQEVVACVPRIDDALFGHGSHNEGGEAIIRNRIDEPRFEPQQSPLLSLLVSTGCSLLSHFPLNIIRFVAWLG